MIMKFAHNRVQSQGLKKIVYFNPYWILGFFCLLLGSFFNLTALGLGDQILFSITSSFSIILNTVFSVLFLRESLILSDFLAICIICVGSTLFLLTAKNDSEVYTSNQLYDNYTRPLSLLFLMCAGGLVVVLMISYLFISKKIRNFYKSTIQVNERASDLEKLHMKNVLKAIEILES